jgi:hypothetical protein
MVNNQTNVKYKTIKNLFNKVKTNKRIKFSTKYRYQNNKLHYKTAEDPFYSYTLTTFTHAVLSIFR